MTLSRRACLGLGMGALASAVSLPSIAGSPRPAGPSAVGGAALANRAGLALLARRLRAAPTLNALIAPTSLASALTMTAGGSAGRTRAEIDRALGRPVETAVEDLGALNRALIADSGPVEVAVANGMFVARDARLREAFARDLATRFGARIEAVDFAPAETLAKVNAWYAEATRGMIARMLDQIPPRTRFVLGSAVAFKGAWLAAFDPRLTTARRFETAAGRAVQVPMLTHPARTLPYRASARFQCVRLGYAGAAYELVIAVPRREAGVDLAEWVAKARPADWASLLDPQGYAPRAGLLALPKLQLASGGEVKPLLTRDPVFGPLLRADADLGGMLEERVLIDRVVHRAVLRMDEEGTEAAGATAVIGTRSSLDRPQRPFRMIVDRPYLLAIRHAATGAVAFAGFIADPTAAG
jgi:serine protease inhibitor